MNRRAFIHRLGLVVAGSIVLPERRRRYWFGHDFASPIETRRIVVVGNPGLGEWEVTLGRVTAAMLAEGLLQLRQHVVMPRLTNRPFAPVDPITGLVLPL